MASHKRANPVGRDARAGTNRPSTSSTSFDLFSSLAFLIELVAAIHQKNEDEDPHVHQKETGPVTPTVDPTSSSGPRVPLPIPTLLFSSTHPPVTLASDTSNPSLLVPRSISFAAEMDGPQRLSPNTQKQGGRRRRSSSLIYQEPPESIEHTSDQAALPNLNANWVNAKGEFATAMDHRTDPVWTRWTVDGGRWTMKKPPD